MSAGERSRCENCPTYQLYRDNPDQIFDTPVVDKTRSDAYMTGQQYVEQIDRPYGCDGPTVWIKDQEAFVTAKLDEDQAFKIAASAIQFQCELFKGIM